MKMEDAWRPVDELTGTAVNTLIYGVETGGLFSNTKVGIRFGSGQLPFTSALAWRAWYNMQSLIDRGLDPLRVLVDRAHERGLDFITSMRMGGGPRDEGFRIGTPGITAGGGGARENSPDFAHPEVRALLFAWLEELAGYPIEGIELDFAFTPFYLKPDEIRDKTPMLTDYVRDISQMVRSKGKNRLVGVRVFRTVEMNLALGLDVQAWLAKKLVDYVAPLFYGYHQLDPNLPFESLVEAARGSGAEIYPVIQPFFMKQEQHATPAMLRAAVANYWAKGASGMIVAPWFHWPLRDAERSFLTDIGDPAVVRERDKHYFVSHRQEDAAALGYGHPLPLNLEKADPAVWKEIRFFVADDPASKRVKTVRLLVKVLNLVEADTLRFQLNGMPLDSEPVRRTSHRYEYRWLDYQLVGVRPRRGENSLTCSLEARPMGLAGGVTIDQVELPVEYDLPHAFGERPDVP